MSKFVPEYLKMPSTVSAEESKKILEETGDVLERSVIPFIVAAQKALESDFVEWRGEGKYVYTPDGKAFFDCVGAGGVFGLGFAHPDIVEAVTLQAKRGGLATRSGFLPGQAELATKLLAIAPDNLEYVYFGNSGTEAMEAAMKLARLATGKKKLIGTHLGYHGMSMATISLSGLGPWRDGIGPFLEGSHLVTHGHLSELEEVMDDDTAAVVLEPVQWASGCRVVSKEYFAGVRELCDRHGALLILDEVQTGLGRTGTKFALEYFGVEPDILCTGKILSGGMVPISAVLYTDAVQRAERMRPMFNNSSFGGNPLACAAGITTLNLLEDKYFDRAAALGDKLGEVFEELKQGYPELIADYHGLGLMRCLEFTIPLYGTIFGEWLRRDASILVAAMGHVPQYVRISPPFICDDADLDKLKEGCVAVLDEISKFSPQELFRDLQAVFQKVSKAMEKGVDDREELHA